ncbi:thioesterase family protein [Astrocystis sublimbata]|nr:thioesterase family protein [Astrocystis sublimbata]
MTTPSRPPSSGGELKSCLLTESFSDFAGAAVTAILHYAASQYVAANLPSHPDVQKLHIEFLRGCVPAESLVTVTQLKLGAMVSTLQLELRQKDKTRVVALATVTDLAKPVGPTLPPSNWFLQPQSSPPPNFEAIEAQKSDPNWLRFRMDDEVFPLTRHLLNMYPAAGFPHQGLADGWIRVASDEDRIDATFLGAMCDLIPSHSDTGLRNGGLYDAHSNHKIVKRWATEQTPPGGGPPAVLTVKRETAFKSPIVHQTITLDVEFKRRLSPEGLRWVYTRSGTRMAHGGRMDLDIVLCDENMELLCVGHQLLVAVDTKRRFGARKPGSSL